MRARVPAIHVDVGARERAIADSRGYVSIHRLIKSEDLGRWMTAREWVVPIDGDPWNWALSNLQFKHAGAHLPKAVRGPARYASSRRAPKARRC